MAIDIPPNPHRETEPANKHQIRFKGRRGFIKRTNIPKASDVTPVNRPERANGFMVGLWRSYLYGRTSN
jgi:hypothetical protein